MRRMMLMYRANERPNTHPKLHFCGFGETFTAIFGSAFPKEYLFVASAFS
jgi:hypothetical protein